jgi:site-specific DNA-methyltransferase (adenine-specific)
MEINKVVCMDNLEYMKSLPSESIDLIYGDILYCTGKKFKDYQDLKPNRVVVESFYIPRLDEMHRLLKVTGSIYLQMDYRIVHWIREIMDDVFGYDNFQNEIIWCYNGGGITKQRFNRKHDNILFYSKTKDYKFNTQYQPYNDNSVGRLKHKHRGEDKSDRVNIGTPMVDWWTDIKCIVNPANVEYVGYDTQKPLSLAERIILASSDKGDTVADFFMGSGFFIAKAKILERNYIGCDINPRAVEITYNRINGYIYE